MPAKDPDYHKKYYKKHKDKLLELKRVRYENDPSYRNRVRNTSKHRYHDKIRPNLDLRTLDKKRESKMKPKEMLLTVNGENRVEIMYPIGELARRLDRATQTIRKWEERDVIPKAMYKDSVGRRLYTEDQMQLVVTLADELLTNATSFAQSPFSERLLEEWNAMPEGVKIYAEEN